MLTPRRFAAPLSASVALVLALSACTTSSVKSQESSPTMSESSAAAATSESSPVNTAAASESADDKLPVGLTDDNKAGKPRPRSSMKDTLKGATINEDGSWTYDKPDGTVMTTNADGTWHWKDEKNGQEATLHADGSWDFDDVKYQQKIHVNADGSWTWEDQRNQSVTVTHADGSWRYEDDRSLDTGLADGTAHHVDKQHSNFNREIKKEHFPAKVPGFPTSYVSKNGVGPNSVVPLKPRTPLKVGQKAVS